MTSFFQRILNPGKAAAESGPARLTLAVFGKHPGWNDHLPGISVETEALAHVKHSLYVTGIGGRIDAGAWRNLEPGKRLEGFDHVFLWLRAGQVLLGRMSSSEDGLHRKEYPLVLCAETEGISIPTILAEALPELERLGAACRATTAAATVELECRTSQERLRNALTGATARPNAPAPGFEARRRFLEHRDLGPDRIGLLRILHELGGTGSAHSRHLRIPLAEHSRNTALALWAEFLRLAVPPSIGLLLVSRQGTDWLDVVVGEPDSDDCFCLQAALTALPLASQVPYELSPALQKQLLELEAKFLGDKAPPPLSPPPAGSGPVPDRDVQAPAPKKRSWFGLALLLLVVIGAGAAVWWFSGNRGSPPAPNPVAALPASNSTSGGTVTSPSPAPVPTATPTSTTQTTPLSSEVASKSPGAAPKTIEPLQVQPDHAKEESPRLTPVPKPLVATADEKQKQEDAGLAEIAVVSGNYDRAVELAQRYAGLSPFKELLVRVAAETNLLHQAEEALRVGNYATILTNQLPENDLFARVRTTAEAEQKLLAAATAQLAAGDYAFLQSEELLKLKSKPPVQKLIQAGTTETGLLKQAETLKTENKAAAVMDLLAKHQLQKPPFAKVRQWAQTELNRLADQNRDLQQAEGFFQRGEYASVLNICTRRVGVVEFDALAKRVAAEQNDLTVATNRFAGGDYGFLTELAVKDYRTKPPFAALARQGETERTQLADLTRLKQAENWTEVLRQLTALPAAVADKKPFVEVRSWAEARYKADEELKGKDPGWLDAWLEILLVRFNELSPTSAKLKTAPARQETALLGVLGTEGKNYYRSNVVWLRGEYQKRNWLTSERAKSLKDLETTIQYRD